MKLFQLSRERFEIVHADISDGSEPALRFYILVAVSTLIASFGLILNSTAVVIGAVLVAPLMTPISASPWLWSEGRRACLAVPFEPRYSGLLLR